MPNLESEQEYLEDESSLLSNNSSLLESEFNESLENLKKSYFQLPLEIVNLIIKLGK